MVVQHILSCFFGTWLIFSQDNHDFVLCVYAFQCEPDWLNHKLLLAGTTEARQAAMELLLLVALPVCKEDTARAVTLFNALVAIAPKVHAL